MSRAKGLFISVEGGDGAGKSTQIKRLAAFLSRDGREVITTREPGGSPGAEEIRKLIVNGDPEKYSPLTEALLMFAARADHLERVILPALKRGAIVITDRFADSSMAYQGLAGALGRDQVSALHALVVGDHDPDITFILDLPVEDGLKRASARAQPHNGEDRFEEKGSAFQQKVREAFLQIAKDNPERCIVIDARSSADEVAMHIQQIIGERIANWL